MSAEISDSVLRLLACCRRGDLAGVRQLVEQEHISVNCEGDENFTPLHCAVISNRFEVVRYLISKGALPTPVTRRQDLHKKEIDESPLTLARKLERFELVREMLQPRPMHNPQLVVFEQLEANAAPRTPIIDQCSICSTDSVELQPLTLCAHAFCADCLSGWFNAQLRDGCHFNCCPAVDCRRVVCFADSLRWVTDRKALDWFMNYCVDAVLETFEDLLRCPKCGLAGFLTQPDCRSVVCAGCEFAFCAQCLDDDHPSMSCKQKAYKSITHEQLERLNDYSADWIQKHAKPCPKCQTPIQHGGACSHMTCKRCSHQFCFVCLGPYQSGRYVYKIDGPCTCLRVGS